MIGAIVFHDNIQLFSDVKYFANLGQGFYK